MKFRRLKIPRGRVYAIITCLVPILTALLCLPPAGQAQQSLAAPSGVFADPLKYVNWISGPQNVTVEDIADICVPDGCRLTEVHGARMILASFNDAIPDDLIGIIAPASGKWMGILEYSPAGYVEDPDMSRIDSNAVLKKVVDQMNSKAKQSVTTLNWQSQPAYDAAQHVLKWSLVAVNSTSTKVLSRTAALFGRHGVLQITIVQPFSPGDVPSLKQLAGTIAFKNGERYTDYQRGDKVAEIGLVELILGEKQAHQTSLANGGFGALAVWIYCGLAACLVTVGVIMLLRRNKAPRLHRRRLSRIHTHVPAPAIQNKALVNNVSSNQLSLALKYHESNGHAVPIPISNHRNGWRLFKRKRRKRVYDFSKSYMNIMRQLSRGSFLSVNATNGKPPSNGHANEHSNGHGNGDSHIHTNGHFKGSAAPNGAAENQTVKPEIVNLIACLQILIAEQKSLLEQQTRLIKEKSRLIEEQTAFLKTQSLWDAHHDNVNVAFSL
jgi:uncharacterized membrane-anchored protein